MKLKYRYIDQAKQILAREEGAVLKDWGGRLPVALVYANTYRLGMSSLAMHTVYRLFNDQPDVVCERVFAPVEIYRSAPPEDEPILSIESQRPLADFAVIAFTISYEMDYFNAVQLLRGAGIPPLAEDRDESWPLIIAGGAFGDIQRRRRRRPNHPRFEVIFLSHEGNARLNGFSVPGHSRDRTTRVMSSCWGASSMNLDTPAMMESRMT